MLDPVVIGILSAIAGYVGGHLHYKIGNSTCLWGLCSVSNVDLEMDREKGVEDSVNSVNQNINQV
jgi:hypothetical protein